MDDPTPLPGPDGRYPPPPYPQPPYQPYPQQHPAAQPPWTGYPPNGYPPNGPPPYGWGPPPVPPWVGHRYPGASFAFVGAIVSVLAFLFLPYASFIVSMTAPQMIDLLTRTDDPAWGAVYLVPVVAALVGVLALVQMMRRNARPSSRTGSFGTIRFLAVLVLLAYVVNIAVLASDKDFRDVGVSIVSYLGVGFWLSGLGMVIAAVGASIELSTLRRWKRQAEHSGGWA